MPYFLVDNFNAGMDVRRNTAAPAGGTVREIRNAFVNRGGEIERRRRWFEVTAVSDMLQDVSLDNAARSIGPIPSVDRSHCFFLVKTEPTADGSTWLSTSYGPYHQSGDYLFGAFEDTDFSVGRTNGRSLGYAAFGGQHIVGVGDDDGTGNINVEWFDVSTLPGEPGPTAISKISAMEGSAPRGSITTAPSAITSRFLTVWAAVPGQFNFRKHATADPDSPSGTGFGEVDVRGQGDPVGRPISVRSYFSQMAVFCEYGVQIWAVDADFASVSYERTISGDFFEAMRSPINFSSGDILYLTNNGVRSLRARDSSNFAVVDDIGSLIDDEIIETLEEDASIPQIAMSIAHTGLSQAWFIVADHVYVLSKYDRAGIQAWSVYDLPGGLWGMDAAPLNGTVCIRNKGDEVYVYGNTDESSSEQYDATDQTTVTTHYFGISDPFSNKLFRAVDLTATGSWTVEYSLDPENETWTPIYDGSENTHYDGDIKIDEHGFVIALRFRTSDASKATLSNFAIHYDKTEDTE